MDSQYLATDGDTAAWPANACLERIVVGTAAASAVVTVYNGTSASGEVKAVITAAAIGNFAFLGARFPRGLFVALSAGNAKVTVSAH